MILVDAGPLVALFDSEDQHHPACTSAFRKIREPMGTVWPALSEAIYLLRDLPMGQDRLLESVTRGAFQLLDLDAADIARMRELMRKYADLPMGMPDAALVRVAEREGIHTVFTVDKTDFSLYRLHGRGRLTVIP